MQSSQVISRYRNIRHAVFKSRDELSLLYKLALAFSFACLTGLAAQVRIPLPFTPVPLTGQVLAVILSGIALGGYYGGLSQIFYVGFGVMGLPWFSGGGSGSGFAAFFYDGFGRGFRSLWLCFCLLFRFGPGLFYFCLVFLCLLHLFHGFGSGCFRKSETHLV